MRIVFPEGDDPRVREASEFLEAEGLADPILLTGIDDLRDARQLAEDGAADAVIASDTVKDEPDSFLFLEREGKNGRLERIVLTGIDAIENLDPEKLLGVQPRITTFPSSDHTVAHLRKEHPLWVAGNASELDDINVLIVPDLSTRDSLAVLFKQFSSFRVYGPISIGSRFTSASLSKDSTTADIIGTAECVAKLIGAAA